MRLAPSLLLSASLLAALPAAAQTVTLTPLAEARLRWERVDQARPAPPRRRGHRPRPHRDRGDRRPLVGAGRGAGQSGDRARLFRRRASGPHPPLIGDPQSIGLYRAQVQYRPTPHPDRGRQRIALDDERFVGTAAIRNNGQTFDAVRAELVPVKGVKADLSYVWGVRTVWGIDGTGARPRSIGGNSVLANLGWATPIGTLTGFAYLIDADEAALQGYRLSSQTYGARLAGSRPLGTAKLAYQASWARQFDYHRNPNDYAADYWLADVALDLNGPAPGRRVRSAGRRSRPGAGQLPDAAVVDLQVPGLGRQVHHHARGRHSRPLCQHRLGLEAGRTGQGARPVRLWHRFESDRLVRHYGTRSTSSPRQGRPHHRVAPLRRLSGRSLRHRHPKALAATGLDHLMEHRPVVAATDTRERLIVIGNGMAGCRAVEELLARDPDRYRITIFGAEPLVNYNRIMLSPVLAGEKTFDEIVINGP